MLFPVEHERTVGCCWLTVKEAAEMQVLKNVQADYYGEKRPSDFQT